ncbi:chromosome partitioning protein ParA [Azomonas macrocytogenes]|uniref:RNase H-fold protein (Predicted Holliday junction resolvase) n=1 Tax=Azomonas macrocytogenes TaxID=69962 RepID=A0A839T9L3_AZOMA|nr:chromosome partitioning protein ParA [Azomonas macrocytogenes]MBB3104725.1 RNase H-fold protein (predicted Holliday junction resolvase) [Azomonas macrocytogenes]
MKKRSKIVEAILFFDEDGSICKEMFYTEFEAILDGIVNLSEFADRRIRAVFVLIDRRLLVHAAVFFLIDFLPDGAADPHWNLPLQALSDHGESGPDLGNGPIRLASHEHCPIDAVRMNLWEPTAGQPSKKDCFQTICEHVQRNQLGLLVEETTAYKPFSTGSAESDGWQASSPMNSYLEARQELALLEKKHEEQCQQLDEEIIRLQHELSQQKQFSTRLEVRLQEQQKSTEQAREEASRQMFQLEQSGQARANEACARLTLEWQLRLDNAEARHRKQVRALEERLQTLSDTCREFAQQHEHSAEVLQRLAEMGMTFSVYHPGAGQLTISLEDMARYQENPQAYAAEKCAVSEEIYRRWLDHYMNPVCQASMLNGQRCSIPIDREELPQRFLPGISDCCVRHKSERLSRRAGSR